MDLPNDDNVAMGGRREVFHIFEFPPWMEADFDKIKLLKPLLDGLSLSDNTSNVK